jgi:hypothetical protein
MRVRRHARVHRRLSILRLSVRRLRAVHLVVLLDDVHLLHVRVHRELGLRRGKHGAAVRGHGHGWPRPNLDGFEEGIDARGVLIMRAV